MSLVKQCMFLSLRTFVRNYSNLVNVDMDNNGIAVVALNRPPVNSLNYEVFETLHKTLVELETLRCRGLILTSSSPKIFSAGLDIHEMHNTSIEKFRKFWSMVQNVWIRLYSTPYPTVAAINGHSPAGGCLLGLSCEYRIIVPKVKIGLNETQLGIVPPQWFQECMKNVIGVRQAERALIGGIMFSSEEALKIGLVDEIALDKEDLMKRAYKFLQVLRGIPALARKTTKLDFRNETLQWLLNNRESDTQNLIDFIFEPNVQEILGKYLDSLKKK